MKEKLIRDGYRVIIAGEKLRIAGKEEIVSLLCDKLVEEAMEVEVALDRENMVEEIGDLVEVFEKLKHILLEHDLVGEGEDKFRYSLYEGADLIDYVKSFVSIIQVKLAMGTKIEWTHLDSFESYVVQLCQKNKIDLESLDNIKLKKLKSRGGFDLGLVLMDEV